MVVPVRVAPRHVRRIARTEFRRTRRKLGDSTVQVVALAVAGLFFSAISFGAASLFAILGRELRTGELADFPISGGVVVGLRGAIGLAAVGLLALATFRTIAQRGSVDEPETLLLAARVRDVVPGILVAETVGYLAWLAVPVVLAVGGFTYGARAPLVLLVLPVVLLGVLLPAIWLGFCLGLVGRHLVTRYEPIARNRTAIGLVAFLVYMGLVFGNGFAVLTELLFEPLQSTPLSGYADLLLLGAPNVDTSPLRAGGAVATTVGLVAVGHVVSVRLANYHWFSDPATETEHERVEGESGVAVGDRLLRIVDRPTRSVVRVVWTRTRRAPIKLVYALYPLFFLVSDVQTIVRTGAIPSHLPWVLGLYVAWGVALAFALNPLGDDGPALEATLTAPVSGRQYVVGHVLAGAAVGIPAAVLVVAPVAFLSPLPAAEAAAAIGVAVLGTLLAPLLAIGVGMTFPRFGSVQVAGNKQAVVPSKTALAAFSLALVTIAGNVALATDAGTRQLLAALANGLVGFLTPWTLGLDPAWLLPVSAVVVAAGIVAPLLSYVYAVQRFERFTLP
ncbi:hypothetical protein SAMN05192554_11046 [Haloarchaeobius iranensis]|uniref:ABC-2 type transport system permease protein n=1 Tax=Haloarchaeobius iranensis TaxID=996166 RepID=A0A1G9XDE3_9EURY|nr:hypothetical protein SAMN05192554_11046 [Haloarchaeobius iranensis]